MNTRELKSLYYGKLAVDPDSPVWEEFEYSNEFERDKWRRFTQPIPHNNWGDYRIRHNPKPKQWKPMGGDWAIDVNCSNVYNAATQNSPVHPTPKSMGLLRTNKEQAEQDLAQIRQFCRFLAWRAENCSYTGILPVLDYVGCFLNNDDYCKLSNSINSGEVEL